jgi:hypothetical protein
VNAEDLDGRGDSERNVLATLRARFQRAGFTLHEVASGFVLCTTTVRHCQNVAELLALAIALGVTQ